MPLPYILANGPGNKPDADKIMANYYWLFAMLQGTFIANGGMEAWTAATSFSNPANGAGLADSWSLEKGGTSAATVDISRSSAQTDTGAYSMKILPTAAGSSNSYVKVKQAAVNPTRFASVTVVFGSRVKVATANKVRLSVTDGVTTAYSPYHTGDGTWQTLNVALACDSALAALTVRLEVTTDFDSDPVYADSIFLYAIEAAMPQAARDALYFFGPEAGGVTITSAVLTDTLTLTGRTTAPTAAAGMMYFNSTDQQFYCCKDGTNWSVLA